MFFIFNSLSNDAGTSKIGKLKVTSSYSTSFGPISHSPLPYGILSPSLLGIICLYSPPPSPLSHSPFLLGILPPPPSICDSSSTILFSKKIQNFLLQTSSVSYVPSSCSTVSFFFVFFDLSATILFPVSFLFPASKLVIGGLWMV
jgi:hypothetical protein